MNDVNTEKRASVLAEQLVKLMGVFSFGDIPHMYSQHIAL